MAAPQIYPFEHLLARHRVGVVRLEEATPETGCSGKAQARPPVASVRIPRAYGRASSGNPVGGLGLKEPERVQEGDPSGSANEAPAWFGAARGSGYCELGVPL